MRKILQSPLPLPKWFPTRDGFGRFAEAFVGPFLIVCGIVHLVGGILIARILLQLNILANLKSFGGREWATLALLPVEQIGVSVLFIVFGRSSIKTFLLQRQRRREGLCLKCGYDLRATPDRCPECGVAVNAKSGR